MQASLREDGEERVRRLMVNVAFLCRHMRQDLGQVLEMTVPEINGWIDALVDVLKMEHGQPEG